MHTFVQLQEKINDEIEKLEITGFPEELYLPIEYTIKQKGKRVRPVLSLMACEVFGGQQSSVMHPAIGFEMFHNFTLIHDDIMDMAPIRRGKETVYKKWNQNTAILSGDTMFAIATNLIVQTDDVFVRPVLKVFNKTAIEVCEGQQLDLNFESRDVVSIPEYIEMIRLKTSVLIGACLQIGAIIGKAKEKDIHSMYAFGENIGLAFQLMDDLLDVFGDEKKFGKRTGGDIVSNKKTFLYLKALEIADEKSLSQLKKLYSQTSLLPEKKIAEVTDIFSRLGIKDATEKTMNFYFQKAIEHLNTVDVEESKKTELHAFAMDLLKRDH